MLPPASKKIVSGCPMKPSAALMSPVGSNTHGYGTWNSLVKLVASCVGSRMSTPANCTRSPYLRAAAEATVLQFDTVRTKKPVHDNRCPLQLRRRYQAYGSVGGGDLPMRPWPHRRHPADRRSDRHRSPASARAMMLEARSGAPHSEVLERVAGFSLGDLPGGHVKRQGA